MTWIDALLESTTPSGPIDLVPDVLVVTNPQLSGADQHGNAELSGDVAVGSVRFGIRLQVPSMQYAIRKAEGVGWPIADLLHKLGLGDLDTAGLAVSEMALSGSARTGLFRAMVVFATSSEGSTWASMSGPEVPFALDGIRLEVGSFGGGAAFAALSASATLGSDLTASVAGTLHRTGSASSPNNWNIRAELDQLDPGAVLTHLGWNGQFGFPTNRAAASVDVEYDSATDAVRVGVALDTAAPIALGPLIADVVAAMPAELSVAGTDFFDSAALTAASLVFTGAKNGDVELDIECSGELGFDGRAAADPGANGDTVGLDLRILIRRSDDAVTVAFEGSISLGGDEPLVLGIDVDYDGSSGTTVVVGSYRSEVVDASTVESNPALVAVPKPVALAGLVPSGLELPDVELFIEHVILGWRKDARSSEYLISLGVAAGDRVQPSVPIVGSLFPDPGLLIGFDVMGSSGTLDSESVAVINRLLRSRDLREIPNSGIRRGLQVAQGRLDLGLDRLDLGAGTTTADEPVIGSPNGGAPLAPPEPTGDDTKWVPVQRAFGPVHVARAGIGYAHEEVTFRLDASIELAGLVLSLDGLGVRTKLEQIEPEVVLTGLGVAYSSDTVSVGGSFVRTGGDSPEFAGSAVIATKAFSLSALGAYRDLGGHPSLFVFAALDRPFGGPPAFHVTGLAMGFGYNRDFVPPPLEAVADHPFLLALGGAASQPDAQQMLDRLGSSVPARVGSYWLAAGVKFESFGMIRSKVVALVRLGTEVEILLLGLSELTLPRGTPQRPYVRAELALTVRIRPAAGTAIAEAMLTDQSYVIDPRCRITGRFAFALWFDPHERNGDFVLTLGGYHPRFRVPDHYPTVPRLGVSWQNGPLTIKGEAYFALTPSCVMAGGQLQAVFRQGALMAEFVLRAHFLIRWDPFAYDIEIGVTVRAEFSKETIFGTIRLGTTLGAEIRIWGPEFAGTARVNWSVFTFDVEFGADPSGPPAQAPLTWDQFSTAFLPSSDSVCEIKITSGLHRELSGDAATDPTDWVVDGDSLVITTRSAVPSTSVEVVAASGSEESVDPDPPPRDSLLGVQPMGANPFDYSVHRISLWSGPTGHERRVDLVGDWSNDGATRQAVPRALWSPDVVVPAPSAEVLESRVVGLAGLRPKPGVEGPGPDAFPLTWFAHQALVPRLVALVAEPAVDVDEKELPEEPADRFGFISDSITTEPAMTNRAAAIARIAAHGFLGGEPSQPVRPDLLASRANVMEIFASSPMRGDGVLGGPARPTHEIEVFDRPVGTGLEAPPVVFRLVVELLAEMSERRYIGSSSAAATAGGASTLIAAAADARTRAVFGSDDAAEPSGLVRRLGARDRAVFQLSRIGEEHAASIADLPRAKLVLGDDGEAAARVIMLDRYSGVISDRTERGTIELGDGSTAVARVVVFGNGPDPDDGIAGVSGWHGSSSVLRAAPRVFVSRAGTFEVQAEDPAGATAARASAVVRMNRVLARVSADGVEVAEPVWQPGWVKTTLPAGVQTVAVYVRRGDSHERQTPTPTVEVTAPSGDRIVLAASHIVHESATEVALLYRVPDGVRASTEPVDIHTRFGGGWILNGVTGHEEHPQLVRESWEPGEPGFPVLSDPTDSEREPLRVEFVASGSTSENRDAA